MLKNTTKQIEEFKKAGNKTYLHLHGYYYGSWKLVISTPMYVGATVPIN